MQRVLALPRGAGDYVHPDEDVHIVDEASGATYKLLVKGSASRPGEEGSVFLYIPAEAIASLSVLDGYCVVELSQPAGDAAGQRRLEHLSQITKG